MNLRNLRITYTLLQVMITNQYTQTKRPRLHGQCSFGRDCLRDIYLEGYRIFMISNEIFISSNVL